MQSRDALVAGTLYSECSGTGLKGHSQLWDRADQDTIFSL